jgi:hypothetical protein
MKRILGAVLVLFLFYTVVFPCTAFVVQGKKLICGNNVDSTNSEIFFSIKKEKAGNVLYMNWKNQLDLIVMNSMGLYYSSMSKDLRDDNFKKELGPNEISIVDGVSQIIGSHEKVNDIRNFLKEKQLISTPQRLPSRHFLCADTYNDNLVAEIWDGKNVIVTNPGKFLVLTGFQYTTFWNKPLKEIYLVDKGNRYLPAYEYIRDRLDTFDVEDAWAVLNKVKNPGVMFTQCSSVLLPEERVAYVSLKSKFDKVWKISLDNGTMESFSGYESKTVFDISEKRVSSVSLPGY